MSELTSDGWNFLVRRTEGRFGKIRRLGTSFLLGGFEADVRDAGFPARVIFGFDCSLDATSTPNMNHAGSEITQCGRLEQLPLLQAAALTSGREDGLSVVIVYQDPPTRGWATELCQRVGTLVGAQALNTRWWKLDDLSQPAVLAGAVSTALRADVLLVAVRAAEGFPLPFYVWVQSWLPHRSPGKAALVALVAYPEQPSLAMDRGLEYLRATARQGHLDFLLEERRLPLEMPSLAACPLGPQGLAQDQAA